MSNIEVINGEKYKYLRKYLEISEKMLEQEKFYLQQIEHYPDAVIIIKDSKIEYVNKQGLNIFGAIDKEEILGAELQVFFHPNEVEVVSEWVQLVRKGEIDSLSELTIIQPSSDQVGVDLKAFPTMYKGEQATHIIIKDITERKNNYKLSMLSEKLSAAGQLAAGIAHEIRNPVTAIKGFLQLVMDQYEDKKMVLKHYEDGKTYFNIMNSEIERIEHILQELLILSKPNDQNYERKNICLLLDQVITFMEPHAVLHNIQIDRNYNAIQKLEILCNASQIKRVFINFIKNAIEAMPTGGKLLIELECDNKDVQIHFIDEGPGISEELIDQIGQPFFTTKESGTGLGMAVSYNIINEHNGFLFINSNENGTCMEVHFPIL